MIWLIRFIAIKVYEARENQEKYAHLASYDEPAMMNWKKMTSIWILLAFEEFEEEENIDIEAVQKEIKV